MPLLLGHFLRHYAAELGLATPEITQEALACLAAYDWPGNVRQLQNTVQFAVLSSRGEPIEPEHLPPEIPNLEGNRIPLFSRDTVSLLDPISGEIKSFQDLELEIYTKVRVLAEGNITRAAQLLGVGRATFYRKIQDLDLELDSTG